jgi:hypothetical protein
LTRTNIGLTFVKKDIEEELECNGPWRIRWRLYVPAFLGLVSSGVCKSQEIPRHFTTGGRNGGRVEAFATMEAITIAKTIMATRAAWEAAVWR